jgi:Pentaxin family
MPFRDSFFTVHDEPREIQFWVANVNASSFISLAVRGHSLYRLNYPLAMKKWHHMCTSWNGKTGEWQLWVSSERVGRGFYNRVSNMISSGTFMKHLNIN